MPPNEPADAPADEYAGTENKNDVNKQLIHIEVRLKNMIYYNYARNIATTDKQTNLYNV